jgi:hypothetical protein
MNTRRVFVGTCQFVIAAVLAAQSGKADIAYSIAPDPSSLPPLALATLVVLIIRRILQARS